MTALNPRDKQAQCGSKVRHATVASAYSAKHALMERYGPQTLRIYLCPWCDFFHLGHLRRAAMNAKIMARRMEKARRKTLWKIADD